MMGSYLPDHVPPQPDECTCEGQPRHIHHPWAWRERQQVIVTAGRQGGKTSAARRAIYEARDRGEHVHIATAAAEEIARAVLEYADGEYRCLHSVQSGMWERQEVRDSLRQYMRRELFVKLADEGLLPAGWPRETVRELAGMGGMVDVELTVPVRRAIP
jgi:hypothetical protein